MPNNEAWKGKKGDGGWWLLCGKLEPHHFLLGEKNGNK
jgi:hypothetical protein